MFFTFYCFSRKFLLFFVRVGAVHATEGCFFSVNDFSIASLVDLAAAVGANIETWLNSYGNQVGEALEEACCQLPSFFCKFEDFLFFFAHWLDCVFDQAFFFELLEKRVDQAWADFFSYSLFEAVEYAVAVGWSFIKNYEYVEA